MPKKFFQKYKKPLAPFPNFTEMQTDSYKDFLKNDLPKIFQEISPIKDYTEKEYSLDFFDLSLGESLTDEYFARTNNLTYAAPIKISAKITDKKSGASKTEEIFLADLPLMTNRGTFIINGVERAVVAQISRSFGLYFMANVSKGRKMFGAKIIPMRGVWVEIETDSDGAMYCRIDRKRKFPVSQLLKVFGLKTPEEIKENFFAKGSPRGEAGEKKEEMSFIEKTLEADETNGVKEAYVDIYKRLRPGEPGAYDTAKEFIDGMLFNSSRYDLSVVGRYKLNQRLNLSLEKVEKQSKVLILEDLIQIIKKMIILNLKPDAQPDDIDHLGNRRVRTVGEMLLERLLIGTLRMKRNIQDRMSTLEPGLLSVSQIINPRPFAAAIKEFFMTGQLSQFMNQQNVLSELEHLRRLSALGPGGLTRERAGFEVRDVHPSHYGRICPIETPEGPNIGLVVHLSIFSRLNKLGILETPYRKVENGKISDEVAYLDAFEETKYNIAHGAVRFNEDGVILDKEVEARIKGQPGVISKNKIHFIDVAPYQAFSVATNLIPFLNHDNANRALMGSVMQRQSVPCVKNEPPLVATGLEEKTAYDSGRLILSEEDGTVVFSDAQKIIVKGDHSKTERVYNLINFLRSNDYTCIHQRPIADVGQKVKKGDALADGFSSKNGQLALGKNLLVAFISFDGANFEDAVVISEKILRNDIFSSIHIGDFPVSVRDTKLGPEITTCDIPNISEEKLKNLDEEGIIRIGAEVRAGDILVGKISPKGESELMPEERLLRAIFGEKAREVKDTSLRLPHGKEGRVVSVKVFSREMGDKLETGVIKLVQIEVAQFRKVSVGDKLTGRHGNKGIIAKILREEDMPYLEDGTPVDIVLNPLGVASRMNLGQILETHLGMAAHRLGYQAIVPPFQGATEEEIKEELKKADWPEDGKVVIYSGKTGEKLNEKATVGYIYMMKLIHMVEDKIHMRSIGPYSLITQQPLGGKAQGGGQRFGEMEVWALEGYGAAHILQEMITIKSDDVVGRAAAYDALVKEEKIKAPNLPASFNVLVNELKGLGLEVDFQDGEL